jgi:hypothetical protein
VKRFLDAGWRAAVIFCACDGEARKPVRIRRGRATVINRAWVGKSDLRSSHRQFSIGRMNPKETKKC